MLVVIVHPEQWNGGSDRCTIGMIKHFVSAGHRVVWYTTMIDDYWQNENFGGVEIRDAKMALHPGDWFSQNVALAWQLVFSDLDPDLIVIDHSASCVPMIKWRFPRVKILFYCHFPQQLVTPSRFFLYRWYSKAIGLIEGTMFNSADLIMVNSHFTERQFLRVMPDVCPSKLMVVYPPCDVDSTSIGNKPISRKQRAYNVHYTFLSMNRFWPEKRLDIIVEAAKMLKSRNRRPRILLAGSVMPHIPESRIYYELLKKMVDDLNVSDLVEFIDSPTEAEKFALYRQCDTVLYTPPNEHFGIVPIEALEQRRPVIVCNSGGPAETVLEGITGSKIEFPDGRLLAEAMEQHMLRPIWPALDNDEDYELQRKRFDFNFSLIGFCKRIDDALAMMLPESRSSLTTSTTSRKYA
ncbi:Alpha-1,3/1,6-mannosyltransferase ALG2 [Toxocara canis]|uniref:Alpha-1,3/1,6-mannosyltransferase ALG2 n=1 Tax=Toxocara canis TaxID=6265 RepID=A0A0B2UYQ0_TOXCA|nr:Alpha-1,3/1,6-mannosyltransferase ALG2 [Toxocara canis]